MLSYKSVVSLIILQLVFKNCGSLCTEPSFSAVKADVKWNFPQEKPLKERVDIKNCADERLTSYSEAISIEFGYVYIPKLTKGAVNNLPKLKELVFSYNNLTEVSPEAFNGLPKLTSVVLMNNKIQTLQPIFNSLNNIKDIMVIDNELSRIEPGVFSKLKLIRTIHLKGNKLTSVWANWFGGNLNSKLETLEVLNLGENQITFIEPKTFYFLPNLVNLHLASNKLTHVSSNAPLSNMRFLSLSDNNFMYIEKKFLDKLTSLTRINIDLNPWRCPCYMDLLSWMTSKFLNEESYDQGNPVCVESKRVVKTCVEEVDQEALDLYKLNIKVEK